MRIEDEIHQESFVSDRQKLLINVLHTHSYVVNELNQFFKAYELTRQQYNVLRILRGQYPESVSIGLIKERMIEKMSDASRIVERLRIKELVDKKRNKDDKRETFITISEKGLQLLHNMDPKTDAFDKIFEHVKDLDVAELNKLLDKVRSS